MADPADTPWPLACHRCGAQLTPGEGSFYIVRIEAFADPTPPRVESARPLAEISAEIDDLVSHMEHMSEQELMDQVYRRLIVLMCNACYTAWIEM